MSKKNKEDGFVFSTNPNFRIDPGDDENSSTPNSKSQDLRVQLDKKNRNGKEATLVTGFIGADRDLEELGKLLKQKCGTGGAVKNGEILIQGNKVQRVMEILSGLGYRVKRIGG